MGTIGFTTAGKRGAQRRLVLTSRDVDMCKDVARFGAVTAATVAAAEYQRMHDNAAFFDWAGHQNDEKRAQKQRDSERIRRGTQRRLAALAGSEIGILETHPTLDGPPAYGITLRGLDVLGIPWMSTFQRAREVEHNGLIARTALTIEALSGWTRRPLTDREARGGYTVEGREVHPINEVPDNVPADHVTTRRPLNDEVQLWPDITLTGMEEGKVFAVEVERTHTRKPAYYTTKTDNLLTSGGAEKVLWIASDDIVTGRVQRGLDRLSEWRSERTRLRHITNFYGDLSPSLVLPEGVGTLDLRRPDRRPLLPPRRVPKAPPRPTAQGV